MKVLNPHILAFLWFLTFQGTGHAQSAGFEYNEFDFERRNGEIADAVSECIGEEYSTSAIANCADQEFYAWDAELNRVYGQLLNRLDPDGQSTLKTAQRAWITYRDAEYGTIDKVISMKSGTMYVLVHIAKRTEVTKHRVEELTSHLFTLEN